MLYFGGIIGVIVVLIAGAGMLTGNAFAERFIEHEEENLNSQLKVTKKGSMKYVTVTPVNETAGIGTEAV